MNEDYDATISPIRSMFGKEKEKGILEEVRKWKKG